MRNLSPAASLVTLLILVLAPGCDTKTSPTEPGPMGGPTITASSGASVALAGTWQSRCFAAPGGSPVASLRETFAITELEIAISIAGFSGADCSGVSLAEELTVDYMLGPESMAMLAGVSVVVTRVDGTVRATGDPFRQVFHIDDTISPRLYHGELQGGPSDADGYPTRLFEEFLERP